MLNLSTDSLLSSKVIQVKALRFVPNSNNKYISIYAQYGNCNNWTPLYIGLPSIPSLQQVRDVNRNISMNSGSYEDAHFYLRSADGNNVMTAFYTDRDGGGIQSGDTEGYKTLNLQPLGGQLNYGGEEVATKAWSQMQGYLTAIPSLQQVASIGNSFTGDLLLGSSGNQIYVGSTAIGEGNTRLGRNTLPNLISGNWNTAIGAWALNALISGANNTMVGESAGNLFSTANNNTGIGDSVLVNVISGEANTAVGFYAGFTVALRGRGDYNIFIGYKTACVYNSSTSTLGNNNIFIGKQAGQELGDSNLLRIGTWNAASNSHIIEGSMVEGSETLLLNSTLSIRDIPAYTTGGNNTVVWNNTSKRLEAVSGGSDQWQDNLGYNYIGANSSHYGSGTGLDSSGGYASRSQELIPPYSGVDDNVEFVYRVDPTNSDWNLYMPDPANYPNRVLTIKNCSTDTGAGIKLNDFPPVLTEAGQLISYLVPVKGDDNMPQWIQVMSCNTTISGNTGWYWIVMKSGRNI